jgi:DNA-binding Lrp family transcriptional regulator
MKGYVLVHAEVGTARRVVTAMHRVGGVVKAEMVTGPYDVIAHVDASGERDLERHIVAEIQALPGVIRVVACPSGPYHLPVAQATG